MKIHGGPEDLRKKKDKQKLNLVRAEKGDVISHGILLNQAHLCWKLWSNLGSFPTAAYYVARHQMVFGKYGNVLFI